MSDAIVGASTCDLWISPKGGGDDAPDIARWWARWRGTANAVPPPGGRLGAFDADICAVRAVFKDVDFETINEAGHSVDVESRGATRRTMTSSSTS